MIRRVTLPIIVLSCSLLSAEALLSLRLPNCANSQCWTNLAMAGGGMGMATSPNKKAGKKKKNGNSGKSKGGASKVSAFDVKASLLRLEKRYDQLLLEQAKQQMASDDDDDEQTWGSSIAQTDNSRIIREYVVAARAAQNQDALKDWIPFAQLCLARPENEYDNSNELAQMAVSTYCRELSHMAAFGAPVFASVARNDVQYSIEPVDSFHKFVYDGVIEGVSGKEMSKAEARQVLGLEKTENLDKAVVKQTYRKLSFELHPDRFEGTEEECQAAAVRFEKVKLAFETLSSGVRQDGSSWYQSLGGRERTDFVGPVNLLPLEAASEQVQRRGCEAALIGLDHDLIQSFVARNLRSA